MTIFIRADNALSQAKSAIQAIHDMDRNQPIAQVKMLEDAVGESAARERLTAMLSTAFAVTALTGPRRSAFTVCWPIRWPNEPKKIRNPAWL